MEGYSRTSCDGEACPQLLDLIPKHAQWVLKNMSERRHEFPGEKKLELSLRLSPPGEGGWEKNSSERQGPSLLSPGYTPNTPSADRGFLDAGDKHSLSQAHKLPSPKAPFLHRQGLHVMAKEPSQPCHVSLVDLQAAEKKAPSPPAAAPANPAVRHTSSQKRTAPPPVVGWPPIRSFRKNLASSSPSMQAQDPQNVSPNKVVSSENPEGCGRKCRFVKINMDGVPIGRKVDLEACGSYEQLSSAVDELFGGLLAAQKGSLDAGGNQNKPVEKGIAGVLHGSGEYTLVYEDDEGDRMLVGDVPWPMFLSAVKRLRVLKSSEISGLSLGGSNKQERARRLNV